jgi:hypothetical protein
MTELASFWHTGLLCAPVLIFRPLIRDEEFPSSSSGIRHPARPILLVLCGMRVNSHSGFYARNECREMINPDVAS